MINRSDEISWVSDIDGEVATGSTWKIRKKNLSAGLHTITVKSGDAETQFTIEINKRRRRRR